MNLKRTHVPASQIYELKMRGATRQCSCSCPADSEIILEKTGAEQILSFYGQPIDVH